MRVLLSIKPEYADQIFSGTKKYEFRKSAFKKSGIKTVVVYSTMPVGKVIGEFEIDKILWEQPHDLWEETKSFAGISRDFFFKYFSGREKAVAIKVGEATRYDQPMNLHDLGDNIKAPQSYRYLPV